MRPWRELDRALLGSSRSLQDINDVHTDPDVIGRPNDETHFIRQFQPTPTGSTRRSRRDILKNAIALGGVTAAETFGPGFVREADAAKRYGHHRHTRTLALPRAFDLRNVGGKNYITSVKDQGTCNSCTAFAVVATIEGSYNWQKNQPISGADMPGFSEAQLFFCNGPPGGCDCRAWYPEDALQGCFAPGGVTDRTNNPNAATRSPSR